ncbi:MAG TPA: hypothetical protein DCQ31_13230 [Bacteroidales bacterium]|nr:hypothetical protein [Bacteroidales bacterium]
MNIEYYLINTLERIFTFEKNIAKLSVAFNLPIDGVQKQLKRKGVFVCPHSGTKVELVSIPILEYKVWRRTHKSKIIKK